jgi:hypothetical protein
MQSRSATGQGLTRITPKNPVSDLPIKSQAVTINSQLNNQSRQGEHIRSSERFRSTI